MKLNYIRILKISLILFIIYDSASVKLNIRLDSRNLPLSFNVTQEIKEVKEHKYSNITFSFVHQKIPIKHHEEIKQNLTKIINDINVTKLENNKISDIINENFTKIINNKNETKIINKLFNKNFTKIIKK